MLILFVSCNQYEPLENSVKEFDFELYNQFVNSDIDYNLSIDSSFRNMSLAEKRPVIEQINQEIGSDLYLSDEILEMLDLPFDDFVALNLENGNLNERDLVFADNFIEDLNDYGDFNVAFTNLQENINSYNISNQEFEKYNKSLNVILIDKDVNYNNYFDSNGEVRGLNCIREFYRCPLSIVSIGSWMHHHSFMLVRFHFSSRCN